jgi:hypothetical protein
MAAGISTTHNTTHTRAGNDVDGESCTLQHLQHTNVGYALGASTTQHQSYFGRLALLLCLLAILSANRLQTYEQQ